MEEKYLQKIVQYSEENHLTDSIEVWPQKWIALRTDLGSSGADNESVVNALAKPLSAANITIFYLSTYSSDYCLVEEHNVARALQVLRNEFKLIVEGEELITSSVEKLKVSEDKLPTMIATEDIKKRKLFFHDCDLHLVRISKENVSPLAVFLLKCFFFSDKDGAKRIMSFIQIEDEVSLLGDFEFFKSLPGDLTGLMSEYSESWKAFSIGEQPLGYSESGIVHSISAPLSACNTSIFYMSTFRTDYCLVIVSDAENSLHTLKNHFILENKID